MIQEYFKDISHTSTLYIVIGAFDGVHFAHQKLIKDAINSAKQNNSQSMIISFNPLPKEYFLGDEFAGNLLPYKQREEILTNMGADYTITIPFELIKDYSEAQFIELLLNKADKIILYSGSDFRMGHHEGHPYKGDRLQKITIEDIKIDNDMCRSSSIRELLTHGKIERANKLLNKEYTLYSHSTPGDKIGRSIDFPTINVQPNKQITPQNGVYFGEIQIFDHIYPSALYIGKRPTVDGIELRIECHVIEDFPYPELDPNTYIEVSFIKRIAEEKSFKSLEELKEMLYNYKNISLGLATKRYQ